MNALIETNRKPPRSMLLQLLAMVLLLMGSKGAWATCAYANGFARTAVDVPISGTFIVPRDVAVGTVITQFWTRVPNGSLVYATCDGPYSINYDLAGTPYTPATGGIFPTNLAGIGVRVYNSNAAITSSYPNSISSSTGGNLIWGSPRPTYQLVVTGKPTGGVVAGSQLPTAQANLDRTLPIFDISALGSVTIQVAACTTPDVVVPLGTHSVTEMASVGAGTTPVSFNISLDSCPAGMNTIQYRIDPATAVIDSAQSIVALGSGSSASGVAVQLLDNAGTSGFPLGSYQVFGGYSTSTGGNYAIPLKARYYRTGAISSGTANTSMTFTMLYQ